MRKRQKRQRHIFRGIEMKNLPHVRDVRAKVRMREHHAFGFAGGAGGVNDGRQLARQDLRSALPVGGNILFATAGDERFVAEAFARNVGATIRDNDILQFGQIAAHGEQLVELRLACHECHLGAAVLQDVGHAVGGFVEINRYGNRPRAVDGQIGGVPFRAVRRQEPNAIARLYAQFHQCGRKSGHPAQELSRRNRLPFAVAARHLRARMRQMVYGIQKARGKRSVAHG